MKDSNMANEVFLSYTRIKEGPEHIITSFHGRLQQKLKEKTRDEISIFFDVENLTPGAVYSKEIEATIHNAKIFLLLFSPTWIQSEWCVKEYKFFVKSMRRNHNKALLPILWTRVREKSFNGRGKKFIQRGLEIPKSWERR